MKNDKHKTTIGILKIGATIVGGIKTKYTSINQYHSKKSKIDICWGNMHLANSMIPLKKNMTVSIESYIGEVGGKEGVKLEQFISFLL